MLNPSMIQEKACSILALKSLEETEAAYSQLTFIFDQFEDATLRAPSVGGRNCMEMDIEGESKLTYWLSRLI
jgi:hypothetical protein